MRFRFVFLSLAACSWMISNFVSCAATHYLIKAKLNLQHFGTDVSVIIAVFRLIHFLNVPSLPSESFALRNLRCSCERKIRMDVLTRAYVANSFYFRFAFLGFGKIVGAVKISPWHADFFHSSTTGDTKRVMRQSDSNLRSCLVLFSRSIFASFRS